MDSVSRRLDEAGNVHISMSTCGGDYIIATTTTQPAPIGFLGKLCAVASGKADRGEKPRICTHHRKTLL